MLWSDKHCKNLASSGKPTSRTTVVIIHPLNENQFKICLFVSKIIPLIERKHFLLEFFTSPSSEPCSHASPARQRHWQGQPCFLAREIIFYHTFLSPKARLWPILITLLLSPRQPTPKWGSKPPCPCQSSCHILHDLQKLCTPSLNYLWYSFSPSSCSPPEARNPAPIN